ncbi:FAD-binding oxidoreductase [Flavobacteriaceae bacterium F89]|uniref:FAD-binding oxidoreductase n=1 Tax=Cerina litoralis TaxID=2874477 RepID=A0AAE3JR58_9FLAO|nr:FAD-dependent oxidoreductase [Cerina litoralis]MCG2459302.1 FAD-binding oxidoreductase [Cerina litoralis]
MSLSYWEYKTWLTQIDFTVVGSGIVGLSTALYLKNRFPKAKILILERGSLPHGASLKNAGFACYGSISEILADLKTQPEEEVVKLVRKRWDGVQLLRKNLGDKAIDFQNYGGHEVFLKEHRERYQQCVEGLGHVNQLLKPIFNQEAYYCHENSFLFNGIVENYITNPLESQIDTGKMMSVLMEVVRKKRINILNAIEVKGFQEIGDHVLVETDHFEFKTRKLLIATNGFAAQLIQEKVRPARAQVLVTRPLKNLHIKGTFHMDEGYYYFRNIRDRILFGGGRNLDFDAEETTAFGETELVQRKLEELLRTVILPNTEFEVDKRWSGIMGIGNSKRPIVKQLSNRVFCGVRLGGMGIAIGSSVGKELADLV